MLNHKVTFNAAGTGPENQESASDWCDTVPTDLFSAQEPAGSGSLEPSGKSNGRNVLKKSATWAFYFALALVFIRFSMIHQILDYLFHRQLYLLYFVGIPVFIGILTTGGLGRTFRYRPAVYWTAFGLWLIPAVLFSTWRGGSFGEVANYYRTEFIMLFAISGLVIRWRQCRWLIYCIAFAALVNVTSIKLLGQLDNNGRTNLPFGTVGNSNDYPGHLIFVLPFLLWIVLDTKSISVRIAGFIALALGIYEILASGSRGGMLGLVAAIVVFVFTAPSKLRRVILFTIPAVVVLAITLLPHAVVHRIFLFSGDSSEKDIEALESSDIRKQLLKDSIRFTIQHPLFGVGPDQFPNEEGMQTGELRPRSRLWFGTHNSFTQIAAESGIPALVFYIGGILSSLLLLNKTDRLCRGRPHLNEIATAIMCLRIALIAFCVAIFFLNFGYFFYLSAMGGIAISVAAATDKLVADQNTGARKQGSISVSSPLLSKSPG
jgi:O-antigen ligase